MEAAVKFSKRVVVCTALCGMVKIFYPKVLVSWNFDSPFDDSHLIQARRFRPARFRPNDSGRMTQAGHDSGLSRFRPVTIQAHLDSGQICTIQA